MKAVFLASLVLVAAADPYVDFLNGLLSTVEPDVSGKIAPCLQASDGGVNAVRQGFALIQSGLKTGNTSAVISGVMMFKTAAADVQTAAEQCNYPQVAADFQKLVQALESSPTSVLTHLLPYIPTVIADLSGAIRAFQTQNYGAAGAQFGNILVIILTDLTSSWRKRAIRSGSGDPYIDLLTGLLSTLEPGVGGNATRCLAGSKGGIVAIRTGLYEIEAGLKYANFTAILAGIQQLRQALVDLQGAAAACNLPTVESDLQQLISMLESDPQGVLLRLLPYAPTVLADVTAAISAFGTGDYYTAGQNIGSILVILLTDGLFRVRRH